MQSAILSLHETGNSTAMPKPDEEIRGLGTQIGNIRERLAAVEVRVNAPPHRIGALPVLLISLVGTAFIGYQAWLGTQVFEQGKKIAGIYQLLTPERLREASKLPTNPRGIKEAKEILVNAQKKNIRIDPETVKQAGNAFLNASATNSQAWGAALAALDYRTHFDVSQPSGEEKKVTAEQAFTVYMEPTENIPGDLTMWTIGFSHPPDVPQLRAINMPDLNRGLYAGPAFLRVETQTVVLDKLFIKRVVFTNSHIIYKGGPVYLENVYFVNCTFEIVQQEKGEKLLKAALDSPVDLTFTIT